MSSSVRNIKPSFSTHHLPLPTTRNPTTIEGVLAGISDLEQAIAAR
jgi:hypothetical protein